MGAKTSKNYRPEPFDLQKWQKTTSTPCIYKKEYGKCILYKNLLSDQIVQQYIVYFDSKKQLEEYVYRFQWRQKEDFVVQGRFLIIQGEDWCCQNLSIKVYLEHTLIRLRQIEDIPYSQHLYILHACFHGFQKLYMRQGYFRPTQDMICVDQTGKIKVWLNKNLSMIQFEGQKKEELFVYNNNQKNEQKMIFEIVKLVELNTSNLECPQISFSSYLRAMKTKKTIKFSNVHNFLENYSKKYTITVPQNFESILKIFNLSATKLNSENNSIFNLQDATNSPVQKNITRVTSLSQIKSSGMIFKSKHQPLSSVLSQKTCEIVQKRVQNKNGSISYQTTAVPSPSIQSSVPPHTNISNLKLQSHKVNNKNNYLKNINIKFNYFLNKPFPQKKPNIQNQIIRSQKCTNLMRQGKLIYSDIDHIYQLDKEISQDLVRFLMI